jgi:hypothetical protein
MKPSTNSSNSGTGMFYSPATATGRSHSTEKTSAFINQRQAMLEKQSTSGSLAKSGQTYFLASSMQTTIEQ